MGVLSRAMQDGGESFAQYLHREVFENIRSPHGQHAPALVPAFSDRDHWCPDLTKTPVFILNLDRRGDRMQNLASIFRNKMPWMGRMACRVGAPDGQSLGDHLNPKVISSKAWNKARNLKKPTMGGPLTAGAAALMMGHARVWERVAQSDQPWSIVMEDDINHIHPKLGDFLCQLRSEDGLDGKWDIIQLQQEHSRVTPEPMTLRRGSTGHLGMYIITKQAAKKLLNSYFPIVPGTEQLDSENGFLRRQLKVFRTDPAGADQVGTQADTDAQIVPGSIQGKQRCLWKSANSNNAVKDCGPIDLSNAIVPGLDKSNLLKFL